MPRPSTRHPLAATCPLTEHQIEIVRLTLDGLTNDETAARLGVATSTIRSTLHNSREKLGLAGAGIGALYSTMLNRGWLHPPADRDYSTWLRATQADLDWLPSSAQCTYLTAFGRFLRRRDRVSAAAMDLAFRLMCWEGGCALPLPTFNPDAAVDRLDAMLLMIARGVTRPHAPRLRGDA